jgi:hypothetical protein
MLCDEVLCQLQFTRTPHVPPIASGLLSPAASGAAILAGVEEGEVQLDSPFRVAAQQLTSSPEREAAGAQAPRAAEAVPEQQAVADGQEGSFPARAVSPFQHCPGPAQGHQQPPSSPKRGGTAQAPPPPPPLPPRHPRRRQAMLRSVDSGALADAELLRVGSLHTSGALPTLAQLASLQPTAASAAALHHPVPALAPPAAATAASAGASGGAMLAGRRAPDALRALAAGNAAARRARAAPATAQLQPVAEGQVQNEEYAAAVLGQQSNRREEEPQPQPLPQPPGQQETAPSDTTEALQEGQPPSGSTSLLGGEGEGASSPAAAAAAAFVDLLLAAGRALGPLIRRMLSLGFNRTWLHAGDVVYR